MPIDRSHCVFSLPGIPDDAHVAVRPIARTIRQWNNFGLSEAMVLLVPWQTGLTGIEIGLQALLVGLLRTPADESVGDTAPLIVFVNAEQLEDCPSRSAFLISVANEG